MKHIFLIFQPDTFGLDHEKLEEESASGELCVNYFNKNVLPNSITRDVNVVIVGQCD